MIYTPDAKDCLITLKDKSNNIEYRIAGLVRENGGRAFYVGGFVRDALLGIDCKDVDIEVHGITAEKLQEILESIGQSLSFGKSFGIYSLAGYDIDIALPRREHATGSGHRDFEVFTDPFIGYKAAAKRRDFTINALMQDVLTGEIIDCFGGQADLQKGIIRHVNSGSFIEDPLRVFRGAQFASRFEFDIAPETAELCRGMDVTPLSRERVEEELKKALLKGKKPSVFFEELRSMDKLKPWFSGPELLAGVNQNPKFHPEGDVWTHTMQVIDRAAEFRNRVSNPYAFMLFCLCHDFGKIDTTEEKNGVIHAYGHETAGMPRVKDFLDGITGESEIKKYVMNMVPLHMKPNMVAAAESSVKTTNRMFDSAFSPGDLVYFSMCDSPVFSGDTPFTGNSEFLFERLEIFNDMMSKPYVAGKDLIDAGMKPGPEFSKVLDYAHKLRLAGIEKESALKQTLSYARSLRIL